MVKQDKEANSPTEKTQRYETLCTAVEQSLHRKMIAQTDFDFLVEAIYTRTHELLSATTLKRLWGKVQSDYTPSAHTLNILAQFLGYSDFDGFCQHQQANDTPPSNPVLSEHIDVEKDINIVKNAPVKSNMPSYPGIPLEFGSAGNDVRSLQIYLNRISRNYPAIPKIPAADGIFDAATEEAVRTFQQVDTSYQSALSGSG